MHRLLFIFFVLFFLFTNCVKKNNPAVVKNEVEAELASEEQKTDNDTKIDPKNSPHRQIILAPGSATLSKLSGNRGQFFQVAAGAGYEIGGINYNTEEYSRIYDNEFRSVVQNPLSTFSIDVDVASYANMRRFLNQNTLPPKDAIRIEELINYFEYDYQALENEHPFSVYTEFAACPWNAKTHLVHIGIQAKQLETDKLSPSNLVFLLDVSRSMNSPDKLPLLKKSFQLLLKELRGQDRVAIVVYAGAAGLVLPSTSGENKTVINEAIQKLQSGGSTAGGAGIELAYKTAEDNFIKGGNNRVILATDGDFNVGISSTADLIRMIEEKRESGIFLTVLGFGTGNYKDSRMEQLADKGNGNYAYIDNILEAKKVLVSEMGGTLFTLAKDVKIQVEFNPELVQAYRLIGYENRKLKAEDFNNDKKDAGEIGSGHSVTALYEIVPAGIDFSLNAVDDLKYQKTMPEADTDFTDELLTVKFRYKKPDEEVSRLIIKTLKKSQFKNEHTSENFRFAAAVAAFGSILRESEFVSGYKFSDVYKLAESAKGKDKNGYRYEFLKLVQQAELLSGISAQ